MTAKRLESLNRKARIIKLAKLGVPYREIAAIEGVDRAWGSHVAVAAGIWRNEIRVRRVTKGV